MGYGDEIMASGHARDEHAKLADSTMKIALCGERSTIRYHELWEGLSYILQPGDQERGVKYVRVRNGPNCRPYIQYPFTRKTGWRWADWKAQDHVGELSIEPYAQPGRDLAESGDFYVFEPNTKFNASNNRRWPWGQYMEVARQLRDDVKLVQLTYSKQRPMKGVESIECDFRTACGFIAASKGLLGSDGGYHHAAAALGVPAVVIFGGCTSAEHLGYPNHFNIVSDLPGTPCGSWLDCDHCYKAMTGISPDQVVAEFRHLVAGDAPGAPVPRQVKKPRRPRQPPGGAVAERSTTSETPGGPPGPTPIEGDSS